MKKHIELIYRIIFIIISILSICLHFDINDGDYNAHEFSFFTIQSNLFCLVLMCILLIKYFMKKDTTSKALMYFKGMAISAILCTFLVYHFAECRLKYPIYTTGLIGIPFESLLSHYVIPFMFIFDWIIFQPKGYFKWWHIFGWLAFPLMYFLCFVTRCCCNDASAFINVEKYPYYFLDYETLGIMNFCKYILVLLAIIISLNVLIVAIDKFMFRIVKKRNVHR